MRAGVQLTRYERRSPEQTEQRRYDEHDQGEGEKAHLVLYDEPVLDRVTITAVARRKPGRVLVRDAGTGGEQPGTEQEQTDRRRDGLGSELAPRHPDHRSTSIAGAGSCGAGVR